jgi:two-component system, chemotaxis family, sensor histidine kinase and response regulator PixL
VSASLPKHETPEPLGWWAVPTLRFVVYCCKNRCQSRQTTDQSTITLSIVMSTISHQSYSYFLIEAQDLLQTLEQGIMQLRSHHTTAQVHELMRAAHTLKGAAASVGLTAIEQVSHILEDIFRAFYSPDVTIDVEIEGLLFQGYECLRLLLTAQLNQAQVDEATVLNRAADVITQLQTRLGDRFDPHAPMPTSAELGFDMVQSMFEIGVTQRIDELTQALNTQDPDLATLLRTNAEIFLGLAESLELPGFAAIAQTTLTALNYHPNQVLELARVAIADFVQARNAVYAGDRAQGGAPSLLLQQWANPAPAPCRNLPPHLVQRLLTAS